MKRVDQFKKFLLSFIYLSHSRADSHRSSTVDPIAQEINAVPTSLSLVPQMDKAPPPPPTGVEKSDNEEDTSSNNFTADTTPTILKQQQSFSFLMNKAEKNYQGTALFLSKVDGEAAKEKQEEEEEEEEEKDEEDKEVDAAMLNSSVDVKSSASDSEDKSSQDDNEEENLIDQNYYDQDSPKLDEDDTAIPRQKKPRQRRSSIMMINATFREKPKCEENHEMRASDKFDDGYENGFSCDRCGTGFPVKSERWYCDICSDNVCFECIPYQDESSSDDSDYSSDDDGSPKNSKSRSRHRMSESLMTPGSTSRRRSSSSKKSPLRASSMSQNHFLAAKKKLSAVAQFSSGSAKLRQNSFVSSSASGYDSTGSIEDKEDKYQKRDLERFAQIKIETMSDMVEDVKIFKDGASVSRKFLYMTNQQVARFDSTNIQKILDAFQLPETNFVIQLLPSYGGIEESKAHQEKRGLAKYCDEIPPHKTPTDAVSTETQTMLFIKHCILPVAMKVSFFFASCFVVVFFFLFFVRLFSLLSLEFFYFCLIVRLGP